MRWIKPVWPVGSRNCWNGIKADRILPNKRGKRENSAMGIKSQVVIYLKLSQRRGSIGESCINIAEEGGGGTIEGG